ncbi:transcriptional regulator, AraC family [Brevibacterium mcbrellneri ATCC 49030]|uniref:Transcriptional regulator, AraC family n=1 Tax=Brevibacterium mcbrellneri ATCC 49030 TaxID=585530 RepID=D4YPH7_9MICO|nr:transcriptional regulator, AraC family [Brevibacterium mcbrellneri ATCC 49030]
MADAVHADLTRPWRLVELAEIAHLSPSRRRQLFVEILEMPPIAWPTLQRVRAIARTISATDTTTRQAAAEVGWMNQAHAAKQYRKLTGRSPTEYRAAYRDRGVRTSPWCGHVC